MKSVSSVYCRKHKILNNDLRTKNRTILFPAVFINDTEENIQETERLIREHNIGGLTFFHSRASAATNYESKKKVEFNDDSYERLKELVVRFQKCATTPLLMSIDAESGIGHAGRKDATISLCHHAWRFAEQFQEFGLPSWKTNWNGPEISGYPL